jgi:molybdenum cofactor cytidylyltransferase
VLRSIVLAAGASSRMGQPKAALPIGRTGETFLSQIIATFIAAELPEIVVVTGAAPHQTRAASGRPDARVRFVQNDNWQSGQLSSLLAGINEPSIAPLEAVLVTLVDIPLVTAATVKTLVRTWRETRAPLVRPARPARSGEGAREEHGHPVIFDASLFDELRRANPATGAKPVVRAHAQAIVNVPIADAGAFLDVDTPDAYAQLLAETKPLR